MTDADKALVVFVESIRWLGVRWGLGPLRRGLSKGGIDAELVYWRWHSTWRGWMVLPALMDRGLIEHEARRLAEYIAQRRGESDERQIHIMGYSCGACVTLRRWNCCRGASTWTTWCFLPGRSIPGATCRMR